MKQIFIYDLDRTVIDSDHRVPYKPNGDLDLSRYYELKSEIRRDTLLPLIRTMRHQYESGHGVHICTSRVIDRRDLQYFQDMYIPYYWLMSRPMDDLRGDAELKRALILERFPSYQHNRAVPVMMYEDNESVLDVLPEIGIIGVNSIELNRKLS